MLTIILALEGLIILFIAVKLIQNARRRKWEDHDAQKIDISLPEEQRMDEGANSEDEKTG